MATALPLLDRAQFLSVRFEDLVRRPAAVITEIAEFLEFDTDVGFPARAAALVHGEPRPDSTTSIPISKWSYAKRAAPVRSCSAGSTLRNERDFKGQMIATGGISVGHAGHAHIVHERMVEPGERSKAAEKSNRPREVVRRATTT